MILFIKTDSPIAEVSLHDGDRRVVERVWEAHRTLARDLLRVCTEVIAEASLSFSDLEGIVVFRGPGSFTGLRIGCMVANTIAYSESIAIVGATGEAWRTAGVQRLNEGHNDSTVLPEYGAAPRITKPKK